MLSVVTSIAVTVLIVYVVFGLAMYFAQPMLLYQPAHEITCTPAELGLDFENVNFESEDGMQLSGWYIPAADTRLTVLFCHGNGGNIMHRLDSVSIFNNLGANCFIFDYRGYGQSQGRPTEQGTYLDAMAAYKWLTEAKNISADGIIIFGRSLGGSIAAQLAANVKAAGLVLESTFTSYIDMGKKYYPYLPVGWFAKYRYDTVEYLKDVRCPVMVIHSGEDELVPFEFGRQLYEAANEPKEFVEIFGGHNDGFLVSGRGYRDAWTNWLKSLQQR